MYKIDIDASKPLRELIFEILREHILTGSLEPGTRLMEEDLAEALGVSRTPIREAIRKLERGGLVTIEPRRGAYVSQMSVEDMLNVLEVRSHLEGLAASLATGRITESELTRLAGAARAFEEAAASGDMSGMVKNNSLFHQIIVKSCRNNYLIEMLEELQEQVLRFRYIYFQDYKRAEEMPQEHRAILNAIKEGRAEDAMQEAFNHIEQLKILIISEYSEQENGQESAD